MREQGPESAASLYSALRESLSSLGRAMADISARSASLFLWERRGALRLLCQFPETAALAGPLLAMNRWRDSLAELDGFVSADSPSARFLAAACRLQPSSFVLFSWGVHRHSGIVAFGFSPGAPLAAFPPHVSSTAQLLALTAWSVTEITRLRAEVAIVSDRLGGRKLVERAKTVLREERGLDEPQAYAFLRKLSRQRRSRMSDIARDVLNSAGAVQTAPSP